MDLWEKSKRKGRLWLLLLAAIGVGFTTALILAKLFSPRTESITTRTRGHDSITTRAVTTQKAHLYFASRNGRYLQAEERGIESQDTSSAIVAIIAALLEGPEDATLVATTPKGTQLLHQFVTDDGTAYVNFNSELSRLHPGGVTAERLTLYAIVNSLVLNLDEVERVQLLLEGKPAPTLTGHLDIRHAKVANLLIVR